MSPCGPVRPRGPRWFQAIAIWLLLHFRSGFTTVSWPVLLATQP